MTSLERAEIWTSASGRGYGSKPPPVVIIQYAGFHLLDSVTFCGLTRDTTDLPFFHILVEPSAENGLDVPSRIMVDEIFTTHKGKLGYRIGRLGARDIARLNQALLVFLGLMG